MSRKTSAVVGGQTGTVEQYNFLRDEARAAAYLLASGTSTLKLYIHDAVVYFPEGKVEFEGGLSPVMSAPAASSRIDVVSFASSSEIVITSGVEADTPSAPDVPANNMPICEVYNKAGQVEITDEDEDMGEGYINKDLRKFLRLDKGEYDAIVAASGGDYTTVQAAIAAGKTRIFVRNGSYTESKWSILSVDTRVVGESRDGVIITTSESGSTAIACAIDYDNFTLERLTFKGHNTAGTPDTRFLFDCVPSKENIIFRDVTIGMIEGTVVKGDNSVIKMYNCKIDAIDKEVSVESLFSDCGFGSVMLGCKIISQEVNDNPMFIFSGMLGTVSGCYITGQQLSGDLSAGGMVSGCTIKAKRHYWGGDGQYVGNRLDNNGMDVGAGNYVLNIQGGSKWTGNYICTSYYARYPVTITAAGTIFTGNYIDTGTQIQLAAERIIFCNNIWNPSGVAQAMDINLTAAAIRCQVNHNIVKCTGNVPTVTDGGSNNNTLNNILYQA